MSVVAPVPSPIATEAKIVIALILLALAFGAGWSVESWRAGARIAEIEKTHAQAVTKAAQANLQALSNDKQRGDALALRLAAYENTLTAFAEEKNREIARITTGRPCLSGAVVRLLNQPADGLRLGGDVPAPAGSAVRPAAAAAADTDYASDTDVAQWAGACRRAYETCRGRIDGIRAYYQGDIQQ